MIDQHPDFNASFVLRLADLLWSRHAVIKVKAEGGRSEVGHGWLVRRSQKRRSGAVTSGK